MSETPVSSRIILAVDTKSLDSAKELIDKTIDYVGVYKLGLEFFLANGIEGVRSIHTYAPTISIFLDLKLHDIPNTVAKAAESLNSLKLKYLTVHASGGSAMVTGAAKALPDCKIIGVTLLTSIDQRELRSLGIEDSPEDLVITWANRAVAAGARAIVASPLEVMALRKNLPREIELITPGIRFEAGRDDQMRTMTPQDAIAAGADYLVVGRPITSAHDVTQAAKLIFESISK
jgi:orotidine-5'-phosphate decarboxylase